MASKKKTDRDDAANADAESQDAAPEAAAEETLQAAPEEPTAQEPVPESAQEPVAEGSAQEPVAEGSAQEPVAEGSAQERAAGDAQTSAREPTEERTGAGEQEEGGEEAPRAKPAVPGAHLEVDIVPEGVDPLGRGGEEYEDPYALEEEYLAPAEADAEHDEEEREQILSQPISSAAIDLAAGARYRATGKRKTAIARVTLRPGSGTYMINGHSLETHFPRAALQRNIRQPLEMVGYHERMDVIARLHGGGISAQAGALRHGVSRALLEADPNLRGELKRRGFLTRDSRAKERKKAGLKKARKRPQFSKR
jgi:small subunit ribosomal protein S9